MAIFTVLTLFSITLYFCYKLHNQKRKVVVSYMDIYSSEAEDGGILFSRKKT